MVMLSLQFKPKYETSRTRGLAVYPNPEFPFRIAYVVQR